MTDLTTPQAPASEQAAEQTTKVASTAKDQAASVAASAKDEAANVASTAADQAKAVASEAAAEAKDVFADARHQLRTQADEQSAKVAAAIRDIGDQLHTMANAGGAGPAKDIVATVADQADGISQRLRDGGLDRTLEDVRRMARNRPGLFLAGAALAGFVATRVARTVDATALRQAATSDEGTNGNNGQPHGLGSSPDLALEAAPPAASQPPLGATPLTAPASTGNTTSTEALR